MNEFLLLFLCLLLLLLLGERHKTMCQTIFRLRLFEQLFSQPDRVCLSPFSCRMHQESGALECIKCQPNHIKRSPEDGCEHFVRVWNVSHSEDTAVILLASKTQQLKPYNDYRVALRHGFNHQDFLIVKNIRQNLNPLDLIRHPPSV